MVLKKLRVDGGQKGVRIPLPEKGFVVLQHRAGELALTINEKRSEPREGEWLTVPLPASVVLATEDDSVLIDLIILEE
jgi:hypothetical protein